MNQKQARLIAAVIFVIVAFSGILFFQKDIKRLILKEDQSKQNKTETTQASVDPNTINAPIQAYSGISGYDFKLLNYQIVADKLTEIGIFNHPYIYWDNQSTGEKPLETIRIYLSQKSNGTKPIINDKTYVKLFDGNILVFFVVDESDLASSGIEEKLFNDFIAVVYKLRYPEVEDKKVSEFASKTVTELKGKNDTFFKLTKL